MSFHSKVQSGGDDPAQYTPNPYPIQQPFPSVSENAFYDPLPWKLVIDVYAIAPKRHWMYENVVSSHRSGQEAWTALNDYKRSMAETNGTAHDIRTVAYQGVMRYLVRTRYDKVVSMWIKNVQAPRPGDRFGLYVLTRYPHAYPRDLDDGSGTTGSEGLIAAGSGDAYLLPDAMSEYPYPG